MEKNETKLESMAMLPGKQTDVTPPVKVLVKPWRILISLCITFIAYMIPLGHGASHRCWVALIFIASMWCSEAIPLYVTSLSTIPLVVFSDVLRKPDGTVMTSAEAVSMATHSFFDPVVLLFMGALTMALALEKYGLGRRCASYVLYKAGTDPKRIVLYMMLLGVFLSCFVSNISAAIICVTSIKPLLDIIRVKDANYPKVMLLAIAFACDLGGATTTIASPQNAVAVSVINDAMHGGRFTQDEREMTMSGWMIVSMPMCLIAIVLDWLLLYKIYKPTIDTIEQVQVPSSRLSRVQWFIVYICVGTIALVCVEPWMDDVVGHAGVLMLIPILLFFGSGILNSKEFNSLPWDLIMLIGGGLSLGSAIRSSRLLEEITSFLQDVASGATLWVAVLMFVVFMTAVSSVISHTVSAIICLPLIAEIGLEFGHCRMFVVLTCLMCSGCMMLPISGFPNTNSFSQMYYDASHDHAPALDDDDEYSHETSVIKKDLINKRSPSSTGTPNTRYLTLADFGGAGSCATAINLVLVMSIAYITAYSSGL